LLEGGGVYLAFLHKRYCLGFMKIKKHTFSNSIPLHIFRPKKQKLYPTMSPNHSFLSLTSTLDRSLSISLVFLSHQSYTHHKSFSIKLVFSPHVSLILTASQTLKKRLLLLLITFDVSLQPSHTHPQVILLLNNELWVLLVLLEMVIISPKP
jgi:hypothetical protein